MTERERFAAHVSPEPNTGCWLWEACLDSGGYGLFRPHRSGMVKAHRYSYVLHRGAVPQGLVLDHLCRVRSCVNPDHLEAVTQRVNARRGLTGINSSLKMNCPQGHPYSGFDNRGKRICKTCANGRAK